MHIIEAMLGVASSSMLVKLGFNDVSGWYTAQNLDDKIKLSFENEDLDFAKNATILWQSGLTGEQKAIFNIHFMVMIFLNM